MNSEYLNRGKHLESMGYHYSVTPIVSNKNH